MNGVALSDFPLALTVFVPVLAGVVEASVDVATAGSTWRRIRVWLCWGLGGVLLRRALRSPAFPTVSTE